MKFEIQVGRARYEVEVVSENGNRKLPAQARIPFGGMQSKLLSLLQTGNGVNLRICRSPVNGVVVRVNARAGDHVEAHDSMLVLEAMKMETSLTAPISGRLKCVNVAPGQAVKTDEVLVEFE